MKIRFHHASGGPLHGAAEHDIDLPSVPRVGESVWFPGETFVVYEVIWLTSRVKYAPVAIVTLG